MWKTVSGFAVLAVLAAGAAALPEPPKQKPAKQKPMDKTEKEMLRVAQAALDAFAKKDLPGLMKLAETPWYQEGRVFKTRKELEDYWKETFANPKFWLYKKKPVIVKIYSYEQARLYFGVSKREKLDKIMKKSDWVLMIRARPYTGFLPMLLSNRNGRIKVVGSSL